MFDLDLPILLVIFAFSSVMIILNYAFRSQFPPSTSMFLIGILWLVIFLNTDSIRLTEYVAQTDTTYNNVTDTITEVNTIAYVELDMYDNVTGEPTILMFTMITVSLIWIVSGVLTEREGIAQYVRR